MSNGIIKFMNFQLIITIWYMIKSNFFLKSNKNILDNKFIFISFRRKFQINAFILASDMLYFIAFEFRNIWFLTKIK